MSRLTRKLTGLLSIAAVIFSQVVVTAHACPLQFTGHDEVGANASAPGPDSDTVDAQTAALCRQHCEQGQQSVNDTPQVALDSLPPVMVLTLLMAPTASTVAAAPTSSLLHATSPPLSIRNCCFRI